ncbi:RNA-guided endonuclease InsQ/TnpB family protein [Streptomyces inhibens]|uniref:RNA-guided endonuclease InsQ/TnpB family protein n=1 Tax=Streptomyces inhibens TaxID=2293571 RepID=UPI001EE7805E|nr:transposase [Streptomyces inhibens]UKY52710.1 transposase [Streptomyces inhibens]
MVKLRLYPTPEQELVLVGQGHAARTLWNLLHEWYTFHAPQRWPSIAEADEAIRQARREIDWLSALPAQTCQQVLKLYVQAWQAARRGARRRPHFHSRARTRLSIDVPQAGAMKIARLNRRWGEASLPLVGRVRFRYSRELPGLGDQAPAGRVTGARLVRETEGWYAAFRCAFQRENPAPGSHPGPAVGLDRGVAVPLATSDPGRPFVSHGPWLHPKERERLRRLERKAARQRRSAQRGQPASSRLQRTYAHIVELRGREKRRRADWHHKVTTELAARYGLVGVEQLNVRAMTASPRGSADRPSRRVAQKTGLNRAILGEGWSRVLALLDYKAVERGGVVVPVPARNTSLRCSACGHVDAKNRKSQAVFECTNPECGYGPVNADVNSAYNIKTDAIHTYEWPRGLACLTALGSRVDGRSVPAWRRRRPRRWLQPNRQPNRVVTA